MKTVLFILALILVTAASIVLANQTEPVGLPVQNQKTPFSPENILAVPTRILEPARTAQPDQATVFLVVRVASVNVHASPEFSGQVIDWFHQNETVILEFCDGEWAKIKDSGWVMGTCFQNNPCGAAGSCQ